MLLMGGGAKIKSIQSGEATLAVGAPSVDVAIASVDITKSFAVISFMNGTDVEAVRDIMVTAHLPAASILRLKREGTVGSMFVHWFVVEFQSGVSVQQIEALIPSGEFLVDSTISPVDPTRTFVVSSWRISLSSTSSITPANLGNQFVAAILADASTVRFNRHSGSYNAYGAAFVVEVQ